VSIATYPGGGKTREPGEPVYKICESEVKTGGLVVTVEGVTTAGNVKVVDTDGATPFGVTVKSTEDPFDKGSFLKNQKIAIVQEGEVDLVLASDNAAIAVGDPVMAVRDAANNDGVIDKLVWNTSTPATLLAGMKALVGFAMEAAAANAGATYPTRIKVKLRILGAGP